MSLFGFWDMLHCQVLCHWHNHINLTYHIWHIIYFEKYKKVKTPMTSVKNTHVQCPLLKPILLEVIWVDYPYLFQCWSSVNLQFLPIFFLDFHLKVGKKAKLLSEKKCKWNEFSTRAKWWSRNFSLSTQLILILPITEYT